MNSTKIEIKDTALHLLEQFSVLFEPTLQASNQMDYNVLITILDIAPGMLQQHQEVKTSSSSSIYPIQWEAIKYTLQSRQLKMC